VNISTPKHLYRARKKDFLTWAAAFFVTLGAGVLPGIGTAVALSTLFFIYHSTAVQITELARVWLSPIQWHAPIKAATDCS
jgi:MFS superfamily sulfate permease-like transporter